jgi:hypothetical protein
MPFLLRFLRLFAAIRFLGPSPLRCYPREIYRLAGVAVQRAQTRMSRSSSLPVLFSESLESVGNFRAAFLLVRKLGDKQRERLGVASYP